MASFRGLRKLLIVALIATVIAVVLPTAVSVAQTADELDCRDSVVVEGRCLSVNGVASICDGVACIEFVEESEMVCPDGAVPFGSDPVTGLVCELTEPAAQSPPDCPDGARGEVGNCYVYFPIGPDGCLSPSNLDATGNCRRDVSDARGYYYCERDGGQLSGLECTTVVDAIPSPCAAGTDRFDGACWHMFGLAAPESCDGHLVSGTIELASGLCEVPLSIPSGPTTCADGTVYGEHPSLILINQGGGAQGEGPIATACVDDSASIGSALTYCLYLDDDYDWGDWGDAGLCTRFELPVTITCPAGYTLDDIGGGICRRLETPIGAACADGSSPESLPIGTWCVFSVDFAEFECPAGETVRHPEWPTCVAYRTWQGAITCGGEPALLLVRDGQYGCFAFVGPQPDTCNGVGTIESCYEIREPAPTTCAPGLSCVTIADCPILDAGGFTDIGNGRYYTAAVEWAACAGITTGTSATTFTPGDVVTRAQLATFLWRYAGEPTGFTHSFGDVPDGKYFTEAVAWMATSEITTGTTETTFSPHDPVTRAQMATFLWRFHGRPVDFSHPFVDVQSPSYYEDAVAWMATTGVTTGTSATTFGPSSPLTRAQAVTFLNRYARLPS